MKRDFFKTLIKCALTGYFGLHRYYTGYEKIGRIYNSFLFIWMIPIPLILLPEISTAVYKIAVAIMFTFIVPLIWAYIDLISICIGKYKDADGNELQKYNPTVGWLVFCALNLFVLRAIVKAKFIFDVIHSLSHMG